MKIHGKKTPALWVALVRILLIWRLKVKCESTNIPRSETLDVLVSWDQLMRYVWGIIDLDLWWMDKTLYLLIGLLMFNCQDLAHDERRSRDYWRSPQLKTSTLKDELHIIQRKRLNSSAMLKYEMKHIHLWHNSMFKPLVIIKKPLKAATFRMKHVNSSHVSLNIICMPFLLHLVFHVIIGLCGLFTCGWTQVHIWNEDRFIPIRTFLLMIVFWHKWSRIGLYKPVAYISRIWPRGTAIAVWRARTVLELFHFYWKVYFRYGYLNVRIIAQPSKSVYTN